MKHGISLKYLLLCALLTPEVYGASARKVTKPDLWFPGTGLVSKGFLNFTHPSASSSLNNRSPRDFLDQYLKSQNPKGLSSKDFKLVQVKASALADHYYFEEQLGSLSIERAQVVLSVDHQTGDLMRVFDHSISKSKVVSHKREITPEVAYDIAWNDVKAHGPLMGTPHLQKVYLETDAGLELVYKTRIPLEAPFGYWEHWIRASNGDILERRDARILEKLTHGDTLARIAAYNGPITSRKEAFQAYEFEQSKQTESLEILSDKSGYVDIKGRVFDPDPRTALGLEALNDESPLEDFRGAYETKVLKDVTFDGSLYRLKGPWIELRDFETPEHEPIAQATNLWNFERGEDGFNEVMTYYHIDQSQRYIQSLGFKGEKGIQYGPILVDSDGLDGADNSHFIPEDNRIAFGRGCVDDTEDADVLLHEYAHALQFSINRNWEGGDTGAMGEGFGDYWAQSYSYRSGKAGKKFLPVFVFQWDGSSDCWSGRRLDVPAQYNPRLNYDAHNSTEDGFVSDELWSTPLYQSLLVLVKKGYSHQQVDKVILEAHFGLGADVTMRDMAGVIVKTAEHLYPNTEIAQVFQSEFQKHNILPVSQL